ncbi:MAG: B12-binding domain-containing protein [Thaumarchaeota archaeon]|nr:B12-binding domain-containing protein [Nitrososphaerota archaeon]MCL5317859.1 B12-binding domain-containing protein [Nitrososphaerota archaeon]
MIRFGGKTNLQTLREALIELREDEAERLINEKLLDGENPLKIVEWLREGINSIGHQYKEGAVGIVELGMASMILQGCLENLRDWYEGVVFPSVGRVIIGTMRGDRGDISRGLVGSLLFGEGFTIYDLGDDVSPEQIVEKTDEISAELVVITGLAEDSIKMIRETVDAIKKSEISARVIVVSRIGIDSAFNIDDNLRMTIHADVVLNNLAAVSDSARELVRNRKTKND